MWTAKSVKDQLPSVAVKIGKRILPGRLSGRLNQFATVTVDIEVIHPAGQVWIDYHVAWDTIANCLNNDRPILV